MRFRDRILFTILVIADKLFDTNLMQREVQRRQKLLADYRKQARNIHQEVSNLENQLEDLHLQLCLLYLRQRHVTDPQDWLYFETGDSNEAGLDLLIEHLVKPRLAAIKVREISPGHHAYHLHPDWKSIADVIGDINNILEPETLSWLHQRMLKQSQSKA